MNEIKITLDGNKWCALLGEELQSGVGGFGDTPQEALENLIREPEFQNWNWNR